MEYPEEKVKGSVDRGSRDCPEGDSDEARSCSGCGTTKTPLWRCGPLGPKSLCNACGIRYKKRGRSNLGLKGGGVGKERRDGVSLKGLGFGVVKQRWSLIQKQKLGEEEQAAVLLMALSSGFLCSPNHYFSQS